MKSLHKLVLRSFLGPFSVALPVLLFLFLIQHLVKYADELTGKGVGFGIILELMFYFSFYIVPKVLSLAILLASIMAFGNLGQHNELTAIKSSGVSLIRLIYPLFIFVLFIAGGFYFYNDYVIPKSNIKAWSLLYDLKVKKAALNLKEGEFNDFQTFKIKTEYLSEDGSFMKNIMVYDHSNDDRRNNKLIVADSGRSYNILDDQYMVFELYNGARYEEDLESKKPGDYTGKQLMHTTFDRQKLIIDIREFLLSRTPEERFSGNRQMKTFGELRAAVDSINAEMLKTRKGSLDRVSAYFSYHFKTPDSTITHVSNFESKPDSHVVRNINKKAKHQAENVRRAGKGLVDDLVDRQRKQRDRYRIEALLRINSCISCVLMFLIGAPLGAIVKKGGLGMPVLISVVFFIAYYVLSLQGEKYAKEGVLDVIVGMSIANVVMLVIGCFFLVLAYRDASLPKIYLFSRITEGLKRKKK